MDLVRELKKLWNMIVTWITVKVGDLKNVLKDMENKQGKQIDQWKNQDQLDDGTVKISENILEYQ